MFRPTVLPWTGDLRPYRCISTQVDDLEGWKANPSLNKYAVLQQLFSNLAHVTHNREQKCNGFSRNKVDNGNWIAESTNYINDVQATGNVCRPEQATPVYPNGTPMTTARPGDTLLIRFWGNGHSRADIGSPKGRDPALVRLFWTGRKETEITKKEDLEKFFIPGTQQGFASNAVILLENGDTTMNEKANYMTFKVPDQIENGRHMMVWSWAWAKSLVSNPPDFKPGDFDRTWAEEFTTCFDINIVDSKFTGMLVPFNPFSVFINLDRCQPHASCPYCSIRVRSCFKPG